MFRYIALIWATASAKQASAARHLRNAVRESSSPWAAVLASDGVQLYAVDSNNNADIQLLPAPDCGAIVGTLFRRNADFEDDSALPLHGLSADESRSIAASRGRQLIDRFWGNYIAFLPDAESGLVRIIKDPTGSLPCYLTSFEGVAVVFSCIADCLELGLSNFTIDSSYLEARVLLESNPARRDPLNEAVRVYGGECITVSPRNSIGRLQRQFYWTPTRFRACDDPIDDPATAARVVRATVRSCVHALALRHSNLLMRLSGGLDSSIIAGCLRDSTQQRHITSYTYFAPGGRSSELDWARLAARHCRLDHIEYPIEASDMDLSLLRNTTPAVEPAMGLMHLQKITLEAQLTAQRQATGVFSGDGGDAVFGSHSISHAVTDYLRHKGLRLGAIRLASQIAAARDMSVGAVLLRSVRDWIAGTGKRATATEDLKSCALVHSDVRRRIGRIDSLPHPWFRNCRVPPGTAERLGALPYVVEYYYGSDPRAWQAEELAPLYAQPVVEILLRTPLHMHCENGHDRTLARRAFVGDVPLPILQRQWKDRAPGVHYRMLQKNLPFLRETLLDGILVREGLLNRQAVELALCGDPTRIQVYPGEILNHLDTEHWARHWSARASYRVAA